MTSGDLSGYVSRAGAHVRRGSCSSGRVVGRDIGQQSTAGIRIVESDPRARCRSHAWRARARVTPKGRISGVGSARARASAGTVSGRRTHAGRPAPRVGRISADTASGGRPCKLRPSSIGSGAETAYSNRRRMNAYAIRGHCSARSDCEGTGTKLLLCRRGRPAAAPDCTPPLPVQPVYRPNAVLAYR